MATYLKCITDAAAEGKIDDGTADTLISRYGDAYEHAQKSGMGPDEADREAGRRTQSSAEKEALEAKRRALLQHRARKRILDGMEKLKLARGHSLKASGGRGGKGGGDVPPLALMPPAKGPFSKGGMMAEGLSLLMSGKGGLSGAPFPSVEGQYKAVRGLFDAMMVDVIEAFETKTGLDTPNRAMLAAVVREAFGEDTGDASAKQIAEGWSKTAEYARKLFNQAGGAISSRPDWGLPQGHHAGRVYAAGRDTWVEALIPMLDRAKMIDDFTRAPFSDSTLRTVLADVWDSIVTHGLISRSVDDRLGVGATAKQRTDERFLAFKNADAWITYQGQFGRSDAFDSMMGHLDGMAHDIAEMQILGPNPDEQFRWLKAYAEKEASHEYAAGHKGAMNHARYHLGRSQDMWDSFTGAANVPGNETLARVGSDTRSLLRSAQLGSAIFTDMPSGLFFGAAARALAGSPMAGDLGQLIKLIAGEEMKHEAATAGFINEAATDGLISTTRDQLRLQTVGSKAAGTVNALARKLPAATLRLSLLSPLFEARKRSFRLSMMRTLHNAKGKSLAQLSDGDFGERFLATELRARGFTEDEWARIGAVDSWKPREGVAFLRPIDIHRAGEEALALRVSEMTLNLEQLAVPVSGTLRSHTLGVGGVRPGTPKGEVIRSLLMYKTFVLNAPMLYGEETAYRLLAAAERGGTDPNSTAGSLLFGLGRYGGLVALAIPLMIAGAVTLQLKAIVNGKDPLHMGDPKFWGAAMLQGGSLGILGDFLFAEHSRFGHGLSISGAGPTADLASDLWDATGGELMDMHDRATNPAHAGKPDVEGRRLANLVRKNTPVLSSLWWTKAIYQRGFVDQLQKALDPRAEAAFQRAQQRMLRETGQEHFWRPGHLTPERAPELSRMFEDHRAH